MEQEPESPRERAEALVSLLVSDWRPTLRQVLWAIRIAFVLGLLVAIGYSYGITLWDWLKLLIVPVVIAAGGLWFNRQQHERGLQVEDQRAQDEALQAYLGYLSERILKDDLPSAEEGTGLRRLTRARTLTVLERLGPKSKGRVMQFLAELGLIQRKPSQSKPTKGKLRSYETFKSEAVVSLRGADLSGANLRRANLYAVGLLNVDLSNANLSSAKLMAAKLRNANLSGANLSEANLSGADLSHATLVGCNLRDVELVGANLSEANLRGVEEWTEEALTMAKSLEGATMPNGQKYEDWLKYKESRREDEA